MEFFKKVFSKYSKLLDDNRLFATFFLIAAFISFMRYWFNDDENQILFIEGLIWMIAAHLHIIEDKLENNQK